MRSPSAHPSAHERSPRTLGSGAKAQEPKLCSLQQLVLWDSCKPTRNQTKSGESESSKQPKSPHQLESPPASLATTLPWQFYPHPKESFCIRKSSLSLLLSLDRLQTPQEWETRKSPLQAHLLNPDHLLRRRRKCSPTQSDQRCRRSLTDSQASDHNSWRPLPRACRRIRRPRDISRFCRSYHLA